MFFLALQAMIASMIKLDPSQRLSAEQYLDEQMDRGFPRCFYTFLLPYVQKILKDFSPDFVIFKQDTSSSKRSNDLVRFDQTSSRLRLHHGQPVRCEQSSGEYQQQSSGSRRGEETESSSMSFDSSFLGSLIDAKTKSKLRKILLDDSLEPLSVRVFSIYTHDWWPWNCCV